jgi:endonuclease-3
MTKPKKDMTKKFNINSFMNILNGHYKNWNTPSVTFIATNHKATPFQVLVSTLLSSRTKDEVTLKAAERLFYVAKTPEQILNLDKQKLEELIYPVGFYHTKAERLRRLSRILIEQYKGTAPDNMECLLKLPGVGRKTANLVLIEGFKKNAVCVDTHVHRISNRTGYVKTTTPDKTEIALRKKLPIKYWLKYNEILVAFGQALCGPISPLCTKCPVSYMCVKAGVTRSR